MSENAFVVQKFYGQIWLDGTPQKSVWWFFKSTFTFDYGVPGTGGVDAVVGTDVSTDTGVVVGAGADVGTDVGAGTGADVGTDVGAGAGVFHSEPTNNILSSPVLQSFLPSLELVSEVRGWQKGVKLQEKL